MLENEFYAGIGSRETPQSILLLMTELAAFLKAKGYIHRGGYAIGADQAFYNGAAPNSIIFNPKEIIIPLGGESHNCPTFKNWNEALEIAERFHGGWKSLSPFAKLLIARNTYQVLGHDLKTPAKFVLCWTPDGAFEKTTRHTGGTGQAIRIANHYKIPVYNLCHKPHLSFIKSVMNGIIEL